MLAAHLTATVTYATPSGRSTHGDVTYATQVAIPARVVYGKTLRYGASNEVMTADAVISLIEIPVEALVWLPGDDTTSTSAGRRVITAKHGASPSGAVWLYETYV
jgi:hypothetical protein